MYRFPHFLITAATKNSDLLAVDSSFSIDPYLYSESLSEVIEVLFGIFRGESRVKPWLPGFLWLV